MISIGRHKYQIHHNDGIEDRAMTTNEKAHLVDIIKRQNDSIKWDGLMVLRSNVFLSKEKILFKHQITSQSLTWSDLGKNVEILSVLKNSANGRNILRLSIDAKGNFKGEPFKDFQKELKRDTRQSHGCYYVINGGNNYQGIEARKWICGHGQIYKDRQKSKDVKHRQGRTRLRKEKSHKCPFAFRICLHPEKEYFFFKCKAEDSYGDNTSLYPVVSISS